MKLTLQGAAHMASSVYGAEIAPGVPTSGPPPIRGYFPQKWVHEQGSGFTGVIYSAPGANHIVLAFAGTDPTSWGDLKADLAIAGNDVPIDQMERANRLYIAANDVRQGREIIVVGHSLGGGLAQFIAAAYGVRAATFNAPAMGAHMEHWSAVTGTSNVNEAALKDRIVNFRSVFDPVSIGLQVLDVVRRGAGAMIGFPIFGGAWARHLGRVVHLGPGAGVHGMGDMTDYIDRHPMATSEPWDVR
ncbi:MAG: YqiA/YcfP family alpha/beta fold hydrolase [Planctomycetota bacterium]